MTTKTVSKPVTVYQLHAGRQLRDYLVAKMPDGTEVREIRLGELSGLIVTGSRGGGPPGWASHVESLAGPGAPMLQASAFAVLLVPLGTWTYAICWGSGWLMVDRDAINFTYASAFAQRRFDENALRAIQSQSINIRAARTTTAIPANGGLGDFGIEPLTTTIQHVTGLAQLADLTCGKANSRPRKVSAGESLNIPLGLTAGDLVADLRAIERAIDRDDRHGVWRHYEYITQLRKDSPVTAKLEESLAEALGSAPETPAEGLSHGWPPNIKVVDPEVEIYMDLVHRGSHIVPEFDLGAIYDEVASLPSDMRVPHLKSIHVHAWDSFENATMGHAPALDWLCYETTLDDESRYVLLGGRWYAFDEEANNRVLADVQHLIDDNRLTLPLPVWERPPKADSRDEHRYCEKVAEECEGYVVFDSRFLKTVLNQKLEICDLLSSDNDLVHVKWLGQSGGSASHLFAQVEAAALAIERERGTVIAQMNDVTSDLSEGARRVGHLSKPKFVLAIAGKKWDADNLYAMARVQLFLLDRQVRALGGTLHFAEIPFRKLDDS